MCVCAHYTRHSYSHWRLSDRVRERAVFPQVSDTSLPAWSNDAIVDFVEIDDEYWEKSSWIGTFDNEVYKTIMCVAQDYLDRGHAGYSLFQVCATIRVCTCARSCATRHHCRSGVQLVVVVVASAAVTVVMVITPMHVYRGA